MAIGRPIEQTPNIADKVVTATATAGQTQFTVTGGYRINHLAVFRNGVRLVNGNDYTALDGLTVTLMEDASNLDVLEFQVFDSFSISDALLTNAASQTVNGDVTVTGTFTVGTGGIGTFVAAEVNVGIVSSNTGITTVQSLQAASSTTTGALQVKGGVGIGKSLYVGGNVSVGGTLTYEDVTNVDSVGLVTAGKGVRVTTGGLVVTAGISTFAGITTVTNTAAFHSKQLNVSAGSTFGGAVTASDNLTVGDTLYLADQVVHTGDTNTKIRFPADDTVTVETAGSERARVTAAGKIGINQVSPYGEVDITLTTEDSNNSLADHGIRLAAIGAENEEVIPISACFISSQNRSRAGIGFISKNAGSDAGYAGAIGFYTRSSADGHGLYRSDEKVRITEVGRVGIGTTVPSVPLHVLSSSTGLKIQRGTESLTVNANYGGASHCALEFTSALSLFPGGGTEKIRIDSSGRLLIGTTDVDPLSDGEVSKLIIKGTDSTASASFTRHSADAGGTGLYLGKSRNATIGSNTIVQSGDELGRITFSGDDGTNINTMGAKIAAYVDGTPGENDMPGRLVFYTTADGAASVSERMRIRQNGQVVINKSDGAYLELTRTSTNTSGVCGKITFGNTDWDSSMASIQSYQDGANDSASLRFYTQPTGGAETERLRITSAGNLGINNSSPNARLEITDTSIAQIRLGYNATKYVKIGRSSSGTYEFFSQENGAALVFGTAESSDGGGAEKVRIDRYGNVGIGTDNPNHELTIYGDELNSRMTHTGSTNKFNSFYTQVDGTGVKFNCYQEVTTTRRPFIFSQYTDERMRIDANGRVGIKTDNAIFGQSTPMTTHTPMVGVQGSVMLANLSTSSTARAQLQFFRRPGAAGQSMSSHTMGDIAWYGSSNDSDNSNMAWSLGCTGTGGSWTSGANRTASMIGTNHDGEMWRFSAYGVFVGRAVVDYEISANQGDNRWANTGAWKTVVDLSGWPTQTLYMADGSMQYSNAYLATFWVYKTRQSAYQVVYDKDSLCHWRMDGSNLQIQQNSGVDQTDTSGYQKVFQICGMK